MRIHGCTKCGTTVTDYDRVCPKCRYRPPTKASRIGFWVVFWIVLGIFIPLAPATTFGQLFCGIAPALILAFYAGYALNRFAERIDDGG